MNKQELQASLNFIFEQNAVLGLELYLIINSNEALTLRRADLGDGDLPNEVLNGFKDYINGRTNLNSEALVKPISELNPLRTTIHHYDMSGLPSGLEAINMPLIPEEIPIFNFESDNINDVKAFLIKISSFEKEIVLYKEHSHLNLLKQAKVFYFVKDNERFVKPEYGVLRFSFTIDFLKIGNEIFVYDINCLEKNFKFNEIIINNAKTKVEEISSLNFVENIDELKSFAGDKSGAKKILSIDKNSPVLNLEFTKIKSFVKNHPYLNKRLKFNEDESMFRFHTHISKIYFIDLLNDNYLTSDLTSLYYITNTKDSVTDDKDTEEEITL